MISTQGLLPAIRRAQTHVSNCLNLRLKSNKISERNRRSLRENKKEAKKRAQRENKKQEEKKLFCIVCLAFVAI